MTDGIRTALGGLSIAAGVALIGAFLIVVGSDATDAIGGLVLFLAGATAVVCFFRIGLALTRRPAPAGSSRML